MMLQSMAVAVELAGSTEAALSILSVSTYDLVISDMWRHGVTDAGLELLR